MTERKNGKAAEGIEIFSHIRRAHEDAAMPSEHPAMTATPGWLANLRQMKAGDANNLIYDEMLQSLSIISQKEKQLIIPEMVIGRAINNPGSMAVVEAVLRLSPSVKGQGRKDLKEIMGGVKQNISMPTALQKTRRILTGRGGKEIENEQTDSVEVGE